MGFMLSVPFQATLLPHGKALNHGPQLRRHNTVIIVIRTIPRIPGIDWILMIKRTIMLAGRPLTLLTTG
jgi:hypothetical protein